MNTRTINHKLIREWIQVNGRGSIEKLAYESGCSSSLVQKLCNESYERIPQLSKIDGICRVTGYDMDDLFPLVEKKKKRSA